MAEAGGAIIENAPNDFLHALFAQRPFSFADGRIFAAFEG